MPSGGYGLDEEDMKMVSNAFNQEDKCCGLLVEWCATYATARSKGAEPKEAARAAYLEWDL